jgi:hypothetical protein
MGVFYLKKLRLTKKSFFHSPTGYQVKARYDIRIFIAPTYYFYIGIL